MASEDIELKKFLTRDTIEVLGIEIRLPVIKITGYGVSGGMDSGLLLELLREAQRVEKEGGVVRLYLRYREWDACGDGIASFIIEKLDVGRGLRVWAEELAKLVKERGSGHITWDKVVEVTLGSGNTSYHARDEVVITIGK